MNFYSLNGSKIDTDNLFEHNPTYERFENISNTQNKSTNLDNAIEEDDEKFASVPTTKSKATDSTYQCSDGYAVKGQNFGKVHTDSNLEDCKKMCVDAGTNCIGFNFNTKNNVCTLKKNASSLKNTEPTTTLCIKKSAGEAGCKVNKNQSGNIKAFNELDSIFNQTDEQEKQGEQGEQEINGSNQNDQTNSNGDYPMKVPEMQSNNDTNTDVNTTDMTVSESMKKETEKSKANMGNEPSGVYVDLDCFMKNINVLQNRTDNMMIDLSLLLSNIKTCSYVKKTNQNDKSIDNNKMNTSQLIDKITSKINIPEPDVVKLKNVKADVLVTGGNDGTSGQILEVVREPFATETNSKSYNWNYQDLVMIAIIVVIIYLLIFRK